MSVNRQYNSNDQCEICGDKITYSDFLKAKELEGNICSSVVCKRVIDQKSQMTPFQFENYLSFQRKHLKNLRENEENRKKYAVQRDQYEKDQHQKVIKAFLDQNPLCSEEDIRLVKLPSGLSEAVSISDERINAYSKHLKTIIEEAVENIERNSNVRDQNIEVKQNEIKMEQRFSEKPELQIMADKFCEMCKGGCCPSGDDHAYLSATTIMQLMTQRPELTVTDVMEMYLSKVNPVSIKGACINQTKLGCSLPRDLRSNICNAYYCPSVKSYLLNDDQAEIRDTKVIAIQWSNTNWNRLDASVEKKIVDVVIVNETETELIT